MRNIIILILISFSSHLSAQFYTGYYVSAPQVHAFSHFKIKQSHGQTKLDGDLKINAYIDHSQIWEQTAAYVSDEVERNRLIKEYSHGEEIISAHTLKFMWDG
ncbi:MAG: hypothetical protein AAFY41_17885, partial [Bacteroidota bacterium]